MKAKIVDFCVTFVITAGLMVGLRLLGEIGSIVFGLVVCAIFAGVTTFLNSEPY